MPERIQRKRAKGWSMPEGAVYVGRPTRWRNPYSWSDRAPDAYGGRESAVRLYRTYLANNPDLVAAIRSELAGRALACWCPPDHPCHADVLLRVARGEEP